LVGVGIEIAENPPGKVCELLMVSIKVDGGEVIVQARSSGVRFGTLRFVLPASFFALFEFFLNRILLNPHGKREYNKL
jgi:hypothetical protein